MYELYRKNIKMIMLIKLTEIACWTSKVNFTHFSKYIFLQNNVIHRLHVTVTFLCMCVCLHIRCCKFLQCQLYPWSYPRWAPVSMSAVHRRWKWAAQMWDEQQREVLQLRRSFQVNPHSHSLHSYTEDTQLGMSPVYLLICFYFTTILVSVGVWLKVLEMWPSSKTQL